MDKFHVGASSSSVIGTDPSMAGASDGDTTNATGGKTLEAPTSAGKDVTSSSMHHRDRSSPLREALYKLGGGGDSTPNTTINSTPHNKERSQGQGEVEEEEEEEEFEDTQAEFDVSHVQFSSPTHNDKDEETEGEGEGFYFSAQEGKCNWTTCYNPYALV